MRAQINRFKSTCHYCTKEMEPESGVLLLDEKGNAGASYHFDCLDIMRSRRARIDVHLGRDEVWATAADSKQAPPEAPRRGIVPPRKKPDVSK